LDFINRRIILMLAVALMVAGGGPVMAGERHQRELQKNWDLLKEGHVRQAINSLKRLARHKDRTVSRPAKLIIARTAFTLKKRSPVPVEVAEKDLRGVIDDKPHDKWTGKAIKLLSKQLVSTRRQELIIKFLEAFLVNEPQNAVHIHVAEALGDIYFNSAKWSKAIKAYKYALAIHKTVEGKPNPYQEIERPEEEKPKKGKKPKKPDYKKEEKPGKPKKAAESPEPFTMDVSDIRRKLKMAAHSKTGEPQATFDQAEVNRQTGYYDVALPLYRKVAKNYPDHKLAHPSNCFTGLCLRKMDKLDEAKAQWIDFLKTDPEGPWRGPARIFLGDLYLETQFDFPKAKELFESALEAYKNGTEGKDGWRYFAFFTHQRIGLVAYVKDKRKEALEWFKAASKFPGPKYYDPANKDVPSGIDILIDKLTNEEEITPREARKGSDKATLVNLLADIAYETDDREKAEYLFSLVAYDTRLKANPAQKAWALYRLGMNNYAMFQFKEALEFFMTVADDHKRVPWADEALMRGGIILFSHQHKPKDALVLFKRVRTEHRKCNMEEKAAYFVGLAHHWSHDHKSAIKEFKAFLRRYPNSDYADPIRQVHLPEAERGVIGPDRVREETEEDRRKREKHNKEHEEERKKKAKNKGKKKGKGKKDKDFEDEL